MNHSWYFAPVRELHGFHVAAQDHFTGARITSLVREIIQNSMDASGTTDTPVKVVFTFDKVVKSDIPEVFSAKSNLENCLRVAQMHESDSGDAETFFADAVKLLNNSIEVPVLGIHDFNTTGLIGSTTQYMDPETKEKSRWKAFVGAEGWSIKSDGEAGGSYGHGKSAPFASSRLGQVFYLSKVKTSEGFEERFLGKTILMSQMANWDEYLTNQAGEKWLSRTGFFWKNSETTEPFTGSEISPIFKEMRYSAGDGIGTSVLIPFPIEGTNLESFWNSAKHAVFANFFYSIVLKKLEVHFPDGYIMNHENIDELFEQYLNLLDPSRDNELLTDLQSSLTISKSQMQNRGSEVSGVFGRYEWRMRVGNEVTNKRVGIARSTGMLITKKPQMHLQNFPGVQNFDLFVCVLGPNGSRILRSTENPAHDNFEFERINDKENRKKAERAYKTFTDELRTIIKTRAGVEIENDEFDDALSELLSGLDSGENKNQNQKRFAIKFGKIRKKGITISKSPNPGEDDGTKGGGVAGGPGIPEEKGGPNPGDGNGAGGSKSSEIRVTDPRMVKVPNSDEKVRLAFTPTATGSFNLGLAKSGIHDMEKIEFSHEGKKTMALPLTVTVGVRVTLELEVEPSNFNYSLEPILSVDVQEKNENK